MEKSLSDTGSAPPSLINKLTSIVERINLDALFSRPQSLEVELGSGDGSFLVERARLNPQTNFLGVERLLGRLRKIDKKGMRAGMTNLRLVRIEAAYLLEFLLPPRSAQALHVYFPDPWPKRKHRKNRLINERFTEIAARSLAPGGVVFLRTDDMDYYSQMLSVFGASKEFLPVETPTELAAVLTDFERVFHARGVSTLRAAYRLR